MQRCVTDTHTSGLTMAGVVQLMMLADALLESSVTEMRVNE